LLIDCIGRFRLVELGGEFIRRASAFHSVPGGFSDKSGPNFNVNYKDTPLYQCVVEKKGELEWTTRKSEHLRQTMHHVLHCRTYTYMKPADISETVKMLLEMRPKRPRVRIRSLAHLGSYRNQSSCSLFDD